jgi:hypothetical protein
MKKELVVLELTRIIRNPTIWVIFFVLMMEELFLRSMFGYSMFQFSTILYFLLGLSLESNNAVKSLDITEYLLSKPFSRMNILYSRLAATFLIIVVFFLSVTLAQNLAKPKMREFEVYGYENVKRYEENTQLEKTYIHLAEKKTQQTLRAEVDALVEQGKLKEAEKKGRFYSEYFEFDTGRREIMIYNFLILIVSALSATLSFNFYNSNATIKKRFSAPNIGFGMLPILLILGATSFGTSSAAMLPFLLFYFEIIFGVAAAWILTLVFLLRKNYLQLSF